VVARMAPGRMPRRRRERQSAALFQSITRGRNQQWDEREGVSRGANRIQPTNSKDGNWWQSPFCKLLVAARWWWGRWSGRRAGAGAGVPVPGAGPSGGASARLGTPITAGAGADRSSASVAGTVRPLVDRLANGILQRP
jgi:hypothetical protein